MIVNFPQKIKLNNKIKLKLSSLNFKEAFEKTKKAGFIAAGALDEVSKIIKPGISDYIDKICYEFINDS